MQLPTSQGVSFLPPGTKLGKYEIIRGVAVGGMAELYLARAAAVEAFDRLVALKRILPQYAADEEFVRMFLDEARLTAKLHHPNIAQVYDIGMDTGGLFFTMEFVHGENAQTLLRTADIKGVPIPLEHAIAIALRVAAGLHAAHEQRGPDGRTLGIVHRDVSPSNVVVSFDGNVKLIDFGVAKARGRHTKTKSGTIKGKVSYMSPEQCRGEPLDHRSDVFSLGIILYELSTTEKLFMADNEFALIRQIAYEDVRRPSERFPDYPPELEAIVMRAMSRNINRRYQSTREFGEELAEFARRHSLDISTAALSGYMRDNFPDSFHTWETMLVDRPQVKEPGARPRGKRNTQRNLQGKRHPTQPTVRLANGPGAPSSAPLAIVPAALAGGVPEELPPAVTEPLAFEELEEVVDAAEIGEAEEIGEADGPAAESPADSMAGQGEPDAGAGEAGSVHATTSPVLGRRSRYRQAGLGLVAVAAIGVLGWAVISGGKPSTQASVQGALEDPPASTKVTPAKDPQDRDQGGDASARKPAQATGRTETRTGQQARKAADSSTELTARTSNDSDEEARSAEKKRQRRSRGASKDATSKDGSTRLREVESTAPAPEERDKEERSKEERSKQERGKQERSKQERSKQERSKQERGKPAGWDPDSPLPPP